MRRRRGEFWRRKRADGSVGDTWWTNLGGERVSTGQTRLDAAKRWKAARELERADPRRARAEAATLEDAIREMYAELRRRGRSAATQQRCRVKLAHFPRLWGLKCKLIDVDAKKIASYIDTRLDDEVARITIRDELAFLRQTLKLARKQGLYPYAIDDVMPDMFETGHKPRRDSVTEENLPKLLEHVIDRHAAHLIFFVVTAGRLADSYRARAEDFDVANWRATVRGSKTEGSYRTIPIEPFLRPWVERMLRLAEPHDNGLLFHEWPNFHRDLRAACKRAGIPAVTSNGLRRTFGKWHRLRGYSLDSISKLFGHTTAKLVRDVYADVEGDELAEVLETERYKTGTRKDETTDIVEGSS